ncbi:hypothetical protein AQUCO_02200009v1 [Aquilegia coerulea]|uniref:RRM domain-containing protein n=1 Tax=Aquilegia coerulea TaxID=218851 RepID=A0A2G5DCQ4_AQUCA|nr:hypothetical protein AQUCO_02200009v1 [Aquilegia coerulea]
MASLEQTIQVLDLSPKVTLTDLDAFFSFCGTVDKILLERKEDQSQLAYVTFRQPYALQTALLLNPKCKFETQIFIPSAHSLVEIMASKGGESLKKAKEVLDERYKLSEKGILLTQQAKMAVSAGAGRVGEVIVSNEHFSAGALWASVALDKAAKCAADLDPTKQIITQLQKTPIDRKGNGNPEWNHQIQFNLKEISSFESNLDKLFLEFDFICVNQLLVFGGKTIGRVRIPIKELIEDNKYNCGVVRFVSYQVVTINEGTPNGVLEFSYKVIDDGIRKYGYPVVDEVLPEILNNSPFQHFVYPSQPPPQTVAMPMPGVYYPTQEIYYTSPPAETTHFPPAEMVSSTLSVYYLYQFCSCGGNCGDLLLSNCAALILCFQMIPHYITYGTSECHVTNKYPIR